MDKLKENLYLLPFVLIGGILLWMKWYLLLGIYMAALLILSLFAILLATSFQGKYKYDYLIYLHPYISWFEERGYKIIKYIEPGSNNPGVELAVIDSDDQIYSTDGHIVIMLRWKSWSSKKTIIEIVMCNGQRYFYPIEQSEIMIKEHLDSLYAELHPNHLM
ncbi:MAG: hypothetical protein HDR48_01595 [Bacteroides sp.]|nr:hypothetical protein [Bacteroides sp.]MBD5418716.1 hypothetical protein [Bacteroides sp.]